MAIQNEIVCVESVRIDEPFICENVATNSLDMENVLPKLNNMLQNEVLQLATIQAQGTFWKPHHHLSIY
jgi:hypothetical protein